MSASQMLQKEASRFSTPDRSRFMKKFSPRSLVFDSSAEISKQNCNGDDITNGFTASPSDPDLSASPEISLQSELTQSSEVKPGLVSAAVGDSTSFNSLEAEIAVGLLRKAMAQVLNSPNAVDSQSRKLLEHLIQVVIEMHQKDPDETDRIGKLLQAKTRVVLVFVLLCSFATVVTWIFSSELQDENNSENARGIETYISGIIPVPYVVAMIEIALKFPRRSLQEWNDGI